MDKYSEWPVNTIKMLKSMNLFWYSTGIVIFEFFIPRFIVYAKIDKYIIKIEFKITNIYISFLHGFLVWKIQGDYSESRKFKRWSCYKYDRRLIWSFDGKDHID